MATRENDDTQWNPMGGSAPPRASPIGALVVEILAAACGSTGAGGESATLNVTTAASTGTVAPAAPTATSGQSRSFDGPSGAEPADEDAWASWENLVNDLLARAEPSGG